MDVRFMNNVLIWVGLVIFQECLWKLENILLIQWNYGILTFEVSIIFASEKCKR